MYKPPIKEVSHKAANATKKHAIGVKHNFRTRMDEAIFLLIVGFFLEPLTRETFAVIGVHLVH